MDPSNFARASEDVIKQRKIVKARRGGEGGGAAKANPFAGIQLAATTAPPAAQAAAANPSAEVSLFGAAGTPAPTPAAAGKAQPAAAAEPGAATEPAAATAQEGAAVASSEQAADKKEEGKDAAAGQQQPDAKPAAPSGGFGAFANAAGGLAFGTSGFGSASGGFGSLGEQLQVALFLHACLLCAGVGVLPRISWSAADAALAYCCLARPLPAVGASSGAGFSFGAASATPISSSIFSFTTTAAPSFSFAAASSTAAAGDAAPAAAAASAAGTGASLFGATPTSGTPIFGTAPAASAKVELPGEQSVTTGEEDERTVFSGVEAGGRRPLLPPSVVASPARRCQHGAWSAPQAGLAANQWAFWLAGCRGGRAV